jgi:hypothetical protein
LEARSDAAYGVLANLHTAQRLGEAGYLPDRDPREVHLEDRLLNVASHPLVSLKYLRYELPFPITRHLQALDLARGGHEVAGVAAVTLSFAGGCELAVTGFEVLGHLLLEDLLQDGFNSLADPGLHVQLHVVLELVFWGQVSPSSLNPQTTRHYLDSRA